MGGLLYNVIILFSGDLTGLIQVKQTVKSGLITFFFFFFYDVIVNDDNSENEKEGQSIHPGINVNQKSSILRG